MATFIYNEWKLRIEYDANQNAIYVGEAQPGVSTSSPNWRIKKITYDANNNATQVDWADNTKEFSKIWDNRASYTYG